MVNNNGKGYYEDISDDLLYVSQSITKKSHLKSLIYQMRKKLLKAS